MATLLKDQNNPKLWAIVLANLVIYWALSQGISLLTDGWKEVTEQLRTLIPMGLGVIVTAVVNSQLSANQKAILVFCRKKDPLPGNRAFSDFGPSDARIDWLSFQHQFGPLPTEPQKQNALWFRMYLAVDDKPAVEYAHRTFLFARDYASLMLIFITIFLPLSTLQFPTWSLIAGYSGFMAIQILIAIRSARVQGESFVTNVLAIHSANPGAFNNIHD